MTKKDNSNIALPPFFDEHPELKAKLVTYLKSVPEEEKKKNVEQYKKFIDGELTWAEIRGITKRMQKELARYAYMKFKMKDFKEAEKIFKGLAITDHTNWYYRSALGAIYQKQKLYDDAIEEYDTAVELKEDEFSSYVNRGECFLMTKDYKLALADFELVLESEGPNNSPWKIRAATLKQRALLAQSGDEK